MKPHFFDLLDPEEGQKASRREHVAKWATCCGVEDSRYGERLAIFAMVAREAAVALWITDKVEKARYRFRKRQNVVCGG